MAHRINGDQRPHVRWEEINGVRIEIVRQGPGHEVALIPRNIRARHIEKHYMERGIGTETHDYGPYFTSVRWVPDE